jgi:hypothetical protein
MKFDANTSGSKCKWHDGSAHHNRYRHAAGAAREIKDPGA